MMNRMSATRTNQLAKRSQRKVPHSWQVLRFQMILETRKQRFVCLVRVKNLLRGEVDGEDADSGVRLRQMRRPKQRRRRLRRSSHARRVNHGRRVSHGRHVSLGRRVSHARLEDYAIREKDATDAMVGMVG